MLTGETTFDFCVMGACTISAQKLGNAFPERGFQLVALLICKQDPDLRRSEAAALLWPEVPTEKARVNLRQLVSRMNRSVGEEIVRSDADILKLAIDQSVDLREIIRLLEEGTLDAQRTALFSFGGPLLHGLSDPGQGFKEWRERQQDRLTARLVEAAVSVLDADTRYGISSIEGLRTLCDRALSIDPNDRRLRIAAARALARTGDHDRSERTLTEDGFSARDPEAAALFRRISASRVHASVATRIIDDTARTKIPRVALLKPRCSVAVSAVLLADRLVEELAFGLARYRSFSVLAPYSSFSVADQHGLPRDNNLLRADYALSGDLEPSGSGISFRLRLTDVENRAIFWSAEYSLLPDDLGRTLRQLMSRVVLSIAAELERRVRDDLRMTTAPSALLHFLEGRALQMRCDLPHVRRARSEFSQALVIDEGFAPAHARIAETLFVEWILRGGSDPELLSAARQRAEQAVRLEPAGPTGHWVSGAVALYQRQWDRVNEAYAEAESLAPHDADMLLEYGDALSHLGDHAAAEAKFQKAIDLNPIPPDRYLWFGASIAFNRLDFATAAERCDRISDKTVALGLRTTSYANAGRMEDARKWARRLKEVLPGMGAEELYRISPDRNGDATRKNYVDGLRRAGVR